MLLCWSLWDDGRDEELEEGHVLLRYFVHGVQYCVELDELSGYSRKKKAVERSWGEGMEDCSIVCLFALLEIGLNLGINFGRTVSWAFLYGESTMAALIDIPPAIVQLQPQPGITFIVYKHQIVCEIHIVSRNC
jgi:hypothetical protein